VHRVGAPLREELLDGGQSDRRDRREHSEAEGLGHRRFDAVEHRVRPVELLPARAHARLDPLPDLDERGPRRAFLTLEPPAEVQVHEQGHAR
jgi:hypothetical protein